MPPDRSGPDLVEETRALDAEQAKRLGVSVIRADVLGTAHGLVSAGASRISRPTGLSVGGSGVEEGELIVVDLAADAQPRIGAEIPAPAA